MVVVEGGEGGEGGGVQGGGFEVLVELAGDACAFVEAEHAERTGELVGRGDGFSAERRREGVGRGQAHVN